MQYNRLLVALGAALVACGLFPDPAGAQDEKVRVAFANYNDEQSFGWIVLRGVRAAAI